jgi:hypothetical protein
MIDSCFDQSDRHHEQALSGHCASIRRQQRIPGSHFHIDCTQRILRRIAIEPYVTHFTLERAVRKHAGPLQHASAIVGFICAVFAAQWASAQPGTGQPVPKSTPEAPSQCPPAGKSRVALLELKSQAFKLDPAGVQALSIALIPCLADPDPQIRDGVAFEALSTWMRGRQVKPETAIRLLSVLQPQLTSQRGQQAADQGFTQPFAALTLAEIVRMDRIEPFLSARQRTSLATSSAAYLKSVADYRGFDAASGWRHGVAHGADLLMQLALNLRVDKPALDENLAAIAAQVSPSQEHFYVYGEPTRLAAATFYTAQRQVHSAEEWTRWFEALTDPAPLENWKSAFTSQRGLSKRHNTLAFLQALYTLLQENGNAQTKERLLPPLQKALEAVW